MKWTPQDITLEGLSSIFFNLPSVNGYGIVDSKQQATRLAIKLCGHVALAGDTSASTPRVL